MKKHLKIAKWEEKYEYWTVNDLYSRRMSHQAVCVCWNEHWFQSQGCYLGVIQRGLNPRIYGKKKFSVFLESLESLLRETSTVERRGQTTTPRNRNLCSPEDTSSLFSAIFFLHHASEHYLFCTKWCTYWGRSGIKPLCFKTLSSSLIMWCFTIFNILFSWLKDGVRTYSVLVKSRLMLSFNNCLSIWKTGIELCFMIIPYADYYL